MSTAIIEDTDTDTKIIEHLDFAILCESGYCENKHRGIHKADWFWDIPCPCGTLTVCDDRRREFFEDDGAWCNTHDEEITPLNSTFIKIDQ